MHVACEKGWSSDSANPPKHNGKLYCALIDTGAEATLISSQLAADIGAEHTASAIVHGLGGTNHFPSAEVQIFIPSQSIVFSGFATVTDLGSAAHTFSAILGRSFLEHCRLEIDGPSQNYQLWWIG